MPKRFNFLFAIIAVCFACGKPKVSDKDLVRIIQLQDHRNADSLLLYLTPETQGELKAEATLALGSVQDSTTASAIGDLLLTDSNHAVKLAAAFSLGQIANHTAINALIPATGSSDLQVRREAFEALGKGIKKADLKAFKPGPADDTTTLNGIAWGIYRAGVRGVVDTTTVTTAKIILNNSTAGSSKLGAAHFFQRANYPLLPGLLEAISYAASNDRDPDVRMAATRALGKFNETAFTTLNSTAIDNDYRIRVSSALALRNKSWNLSKTLFGQLVNDANVHVSVAAAEVISAVAPASEVEQILAWAREARNWRTQAELYGCALRLSPSTEIDNEVKAIYSKVSNVYQQAALLTALSNHVNNYQFIFAQTKSDVKVIKSTAASALGRINYNDAFPASLQKEFASMYQQLVEGGDHGAIIYACGVLRDSTKGYKKIITDFSFLETAKSKLSLPRDYETYVPLDETLAYFKGLPIPPRLENKFNHPIDIELLKKIKPDQHVIIKTTKGDIEMKLFPGEAPGSVVNFVQLINQKYFDGKIFHRVVPNFVIQTGCNRGDGFGSEDYSLRSEFSPRKYTTGSVGMASAGKDTEGTQWFITHSPTPHLDGRYTIFAEVVRGMDVVHKIELGDSIIEARLID